MIRPATLLWVALTGAVGFGLYHLKQEVQKQEDELFRLNRAILTEQEAIHVLRAEWSYINQPARLQSLSQRHLDLHLTKPTQLGTVASLPLIMNGPLTANGPLVATDTAKPTGPSIAMMPEPLPATGAVRTPQGVLEPAKFSGPTLLPTLGRPTSAGPR